MSDWRSVNDLFPEDEEPDLRIWNRADIEDRLRIRRKAEKEGDPREEAPTDREGEGTSR